MSTTEKDLRLSAQRALLGAIGPHVQAVCVASDGDAITLTVFSYETLTEDEREALEVAASEIIADFPSANSIDVQVVEHPAEPFDITGYWLYKAFDDKLAS